MAESERLRIELTQVKKLSAVGELAANVAHEVNNILTVVMGQAQLLLLGSLPDEARERVRKLYGEASQAVRIVQSLLYFARHQPAPKRAVPLSDLLARVLDLMHYRLQSNRIRLSAELGAVPQIEGDAPQLQQVFFNLIQNAQQAMTASHGGGTLTVRIRAVPGGEGERAEWARVEIEDDGPGIPPEIFDRIFDPFVTTKPPGEGSGLGLSISREIVEEHGGRIWAENRPGGGARFSVELPLLTSRQRRENPVSH
jgi:signal transduction histidine kinase